MPTDQLVCQRVVFYTKINLFINNVLSQVIYQKLGAYLVNKLSCLSSLIRSAHMGFCRFLLYLFSLCLFFFGLITYQLFWQFCIFILLIYFIFSNIIPRPWKLLEFGLQSKAHKLCNCISTSFITQLKTRHQPSFFLTRLSFSLKNGSSKSKNKNCFIMQSIWDT